MKQVIGYSWTQVNSATPTNEKPLVAERRPRRAERSQAVEVLMNVHASYATPLSGIAQERCVFPSKVCYNTSTHRARHKRRNPGRVDAQPGLLTPTSERISFAMNANSSFYHNRIEQDDRIVLALRYPTDSDEPPIASVHRTIAGRRYWLAVYDADVLATLLDMGWQSGGAS